jgi:hypothetical protein
MEEVIGVEEEQVTSLRYADPRVTGGAKSAIGFADIGQSFAVASCYVIRLVVGPVVDDHNLN